MYKFILALIFFLSVATMTAISDTPTVYICTGGKSTCYHRTPTCSGLNRCSASIKAISLDKAKKMGRRPCKKCY